MEETDNTLDNDIALMMRLKAGDETVFEEIVRRHKQPILNIVYRYLGSIEEAEDLAQEVFLRLYRSRKRYMPTAKFSTYLYHITANLCLNLRRRARLAKMHSIETYPHSADNDPRPELEDKDAPQPDERLHRSELIAEVRGALHSLPDQQRIALILARYEQLSYKEIAAVMSISTSAVKSLLWRARESARKKLLPLIEKREKSE